MTDPVTESPKLFCSKPFEWFEVQHFPKPGDVYLCCPSWLKGPVGNLVDQSMEEVWNGQEAQELRRSILDGSFRYCDGDKCPFLKTMSFPVQPSDKVVVPEFRRIIDEGLTRLPFGPSTVNCSYDRSCNLACPSCRTQVLIERNHELEILEIQEKISGDALKQARTLYITGSGDPFGSPYFRKWLQQMRRADAPQLKQIHLHTNAQMWTRNIWESIHVEIRSIVRSAEISIDAATAETYAVNRWPGHFHKLLENLEFVQLLRREGPLKGLAFSMVVQDNNFREMPAFIELGRRFGADRVTFSQLTNWGTFSEQAFRERAVHFASHPRHAALRELLRSPVFVAPDVFLGNLADLRTS